MTDDIDRDRDMEKLMEELDDDMGFTGMGEGIHRREGLPGGKSRGKILLLGGAVIIIAVAAVAFILPNMGSNVSTGNLTSLETKINQLEKKVSEFKAVSNRITALEERATVLQQHTEEVDKLAKSLMLQGDKLTEELASLQKHAAPAAVKAKTPVTSHVQAAPSGEKGYHKILKGENLYRISLKYGITVDELCRLNDITPKTAIYPGQKLLVTPGS